MSGNLSKRTVSVQAMGFMGFSKTYTIPLRSGTVVYNIKQRDATKAAVRSSAWAGTFTFNPQHVTDYKLLEQVCFKVKTKT